MGGFLARQAAFLQRNPRHPTQLLATLRSPRSARARAVLSTSILLHHRRVLTSQLAGIIRLLQALHLMRTVMRRAASVGLSSTLCLLANLRSQHLRTYLERLISQHKIIRSREQPHHRNRRLSQPSSPKIIRHLLRSAKHQ